MTFSLTGCRRLNKPVNPETLLQAANETTPGYDVLAVARYCDTYLHAPNLPAVSTLLNTFGDPLPCIKRKLQQGTLTTVQVDLMDATCWRNKVCPPGTPSLTNWKVLKARAERVAKLAAQFPTVKWWISPWLEHDIKDSNTIRKACGIVESSSPLFKCINSPVSGARPANIPVELHGTRVTAFAVSGDGASSFDGDNIAADGNNFQHRISGSNQTYFWSNSFNLRCQGEETFIPPLKRTERPEPWEFQSAHKIMTSIEDPYPVAPAICKTVRRVRAPEINKPLAEKYCNGQPNENDSRGNKPLLILKKIGRPGQRLDIYRSTGTSPVGYFRGYGSYTNSSLYRWYLGNGSGQPSWELYRALGNEWGFLHLGSGNCLLFNALRREGVYR